MIREALRVPYNKLVRQHLPRKIGVYNGVSVRFPKFLDFEDHVQDWKAGTVGGVKEAVDIGDTVVEIGSGFGVCTVWAARKVTETGNVFTYEASSNRFDILNETLELNGVSENVRTHHALVGNDIDVFGPLSEAEKISPSKLTNCDVLVTDCEGAELEILSDLQQRDEFQPRSVVIETHGFAGSETEAVIDILESQGYHIESVTMASPYSNEEEDNRVVTATHE